MNVEHRCKEEVITSFHTKFISEQRNAIVNGAFGSGRRRHPYALGRFSGKLRSFEPPFNCYFSQFSHTLVKLLLHWHIHCCQSLHRARKSQNCQSKVINFNQKKTRCCTLRVPWCRPVVQAVAPVRKLTVVITEIVPFNKLNFFSFSRSRVKQG